MLPNDQIAGQRLMVGFNGTEFNATVQSLIEELKVGGLILFAQNVQSPDQLRSLCRLTQECARAAGLPPLLISIDQEGGEVARLKAPLFTEFPGNPAMQMRDDAVAFAQLCAGELIDAGINMNLAPVMDVCPEDFDGIMKKRVFGPDPQWVAQMGGTVIDELQKQNIMAVAKHFPGIGRTTLDSHLDMPYLETSVDALYAYDLIPFTTAIHRHVAGIMLSHICYTDLDPDWPASLSVKVVKQILRGEMGYEGIVMTDDLDMGAIIKRYDMKTCIQQIVRAEVDITLVCHEGPGIRQAFDFLVEELESSEQNYLSSLACVERIMDCKNRYLGEK